MFSAILEGEPVGDDQFEVAPRAIELLVKAILNSKGTCSKLADE